MLRIAATLIALSLAAAACSDPPADPLVAADVQAPSTEVAPAGDDQAATTLTTATDEGSAATPVADPYEVYLQLAAEQLAETDQIEISRDDAQARALLGCGSTWAPGTVDALLATAYADLIAQWTDEGLCG